MSEVLVTGGCGFIGREVCSELVASGHTVRVLGRDLRVSYEDWRKGDQYYFVADTRRLEGETGWSSAVSWRDGLRALAQWLRTNRHIVERHTAAAAALREETV